MTCVATVVGHSFGEFVALALEGHYNIQTITCGAPVLDLLSSSGTNRHRHLFDP